MGTDIETRLYRTDPNWVMKKILLLTDVSLRKSAGLSFLGRWMNVLLPLMVRLISIGENFGVQGTKKDPQRLF